MLTKEQAKRIVTDSIKKVSGSSKSVEAKTLKEVGIVSDQEFQSLLTTIVSDPAIGVRGLGHYLDPNDLADLATQQPGWALRVGSLAAKVLELSRGKLCSNPHNPHPQKCCPYPATCPQCGYSVV
jgi:hypothetical protein